MAKGKASKEGNDIGIDLANNMAKAITRVLSTYDFSPLNKNLVKGLGRVDVSNLLKSNDVKIKELASNAKQTLQKGIGEVTVAPTLDKSKFSELQKTTQQQIKTPTLDATPLEKAGDLVRTLINLTEQANKKTTITADLYKRITEVADKLVASKRMEKDAAEDIAKAYQVKLPPLKLKTELEKIDTKAVEAQASKLKPVDLKASISSIDATQMGKLDPVDLKASITSVDTSIIKKQLPAAELKAVVESVDTKAIDEQVKKIDLIGLQALVTEVDTTLIKEEVAKVNPVKLQANVLTIDTTPLQEAKDLIQQSTESAQELEQITNKTTKGRFSETAALSTVVDKSKVLAELEAAKIQPAKEFYNFLEKSKLTYKQLDDLVGIITGGQGELNRTYESGTAAVSKVLELEKAVEQAIKKSYSAKATVQIKEKANADLLNLLADKEFKQQLKSLTEEQKHALLTKKYAEFESNHLAKKQNMEQGYYSRAISSRRKLLATLQDEASQTKLHEDALLAINEHLQDGRQLLDAQAESIGATGKLQDFVVAQLKKGQSIQEIQNDETFKTLKLSEKESEKLKERYQAQGELAKFQEKYKDSYKASNQLMQETLQHSNLIFFKQVDVNKAVQDNIKARKDLIELAATEGEAGKSAMSLLSAELDLYKLQAEVKGYEGEAAKYVVEQLGKGRALSDIQKDIALETLETNEKSIDFRKKDLELQLLTTKRMKEIRESHDKIKDKIKQTLDFSKELAKDPKALGMFAAAQVGIGLHKANHAMHELVDSGMQAGEAIHVMADGISVMSVLGLSKVSGVNKEIIAQYGTMNVLTKDQRHTIGEMATKFGLAEQEAVNLTMAISRMPGESADTAKNFGETAKRVGQMKGVLPSAIMKEMAKNSGLMAVYSKGGAEGFAKAAASSKRMGIELSSILNAAEKTLDFESSINAQMEASLLIGKSMNFDRLRAAALSGDANAIMEEQTAIMRQVGSLDNMNVLQKKKLAEAMGMTVEELTKFNEAQQMEQKYFGENSSMLENAIGGIMKYGGAVLGFAAQNGLMILGIGQTIIQFGALRAAKEANRIATMKDMGADQLNEGNKKRGILTIIGQTAVSVKNRIAKLLGIGVTNLETQSELNNELTKKKGIGTTLMQMGVNLKNRIAKLLGIGTTTTEIAVENTKDLANKKSIGTTISQTAIEARKRIGRLLGIGTTATETLSENVSGASKQKNTGLTSVQTFQENARRLGRLLGIGVTTAENTIENTSTATKGRGVLATIALNAVTLARNIIVGAGNIVLGVANGLLSLFGINTATAGAAGAGAAPGIVAFGTAIGAAGSAMIPAIPIILALGLALWMATPAFKVFGEVITAVATVIGNVLMKALEMLPAIIGAVAAGFTQIFTTVANNWQILIPLGLSLGVLGIGLTAAAAGLTVFGAAALFAAPGLLAVSAAVLLMTPALLVLQQLVNSVQGVTGALTALSTVASSLAMVGGAVAAIGAGLALMSYAGMAAMPIIGALVGLAAVAPALTALGGILGGEGGGGQATQQQTTTKASNESAKDDSMKILIDEIRGLRSEIAGGGVINMDGRKVGEVLRLVMNTSGVR